MTPLCRVAFLCWLLTNVMLSMPVLLYGGHMLLATGIFQLLALLFFSTATSLSPPCRLHLGTVELHTQYGPAFWITLATGEAQLTTYPPPWGCGQRGRSRARRAGEAETLLPGATWALRQPPAACVPRTALPAAGPAHGSGPQGAAPQAEGPLQPEL